MRGLIPILSVCLLLPSMAACGGGDGDPQIDCQGDAVCEGCLDHPRGPWCYSDAAGEADDPDMCSNITKYWGEDAATVAAYCIYKIAKKNKDCSLCSRILDAQVKSMCDEDCQ